MKRTATITTILITTAAMTGIGATNALAELPEILAGAGAHAKAKSTTTSNELVSKAGTISCSAAFGEGTVPKTGEKVSSTLRLTGCESKKAKCETLGQKEEGVMVIAGEGAPVTVELSGGKLGLGAYAKISGTVHIECGAGILLFLVEGSVIGEALNVTVEEASGVLLSLFAANTPYESALDQTEGKQALTKCISPKADCESEDILLVNFGKGYERAGLLTVGAGEASEKEHVDY